jgi:hypothetical protein
LHRGEVLIESPFMSFSTLQWIAFLLLFALVFAVAIGAVPGGT